MGYPRPKNISCKIHYFLVGRLTYISIIKLTGHVKKKIDICIRHDWIIFDTVDEAMEFFNDCCGEFVGYYV